MSSIMAAIFQSKFDPKTREDILKAFTKNTPLQHLLQEEVEKKIFEHNSVRGVEPGALLRKQGVVEGLEIALGVLKSLKPGE